MSRANPRFKRTNAPLPAIPGGSHVVLYRILGNLESQLTISTFYWMGANANPTSTQLTTLLTAISAGLFTKYAALCSADWTGRQERLDVVDVNSIAGVLSNANQGVAGTRTAGHEPTEVAQPVIRYTAVKGQHGRGRFSIPGISTADVTGSAIVAGTWNTALGLFNTAMMAAYSDGANSWIAVLASRSSTAPRLANGASALTSAVKSPLLGTIRRRKIGRGK